MKETRITNALEFIDDSLIDEAREPRRKIPFIRLGGIAACLAVALLVGYFAIHYSPSPDPVIPDRDNVPPVEDVTDKTGTDTPQSGLTDQTGSNSSQTGGGADVTPDKPNDPDPDDSVLGNRPYNDLIFSSGNDEIHYIPRWEERDLFERYGTISIDGKYYSRNSSIAHRVMTKPEYVGASLGFYEGRGYDSYTDTTHTMDFEVFEIRGVSKNLLVAVKIEDEYFIYVSASTKNAPLTLGELISDYWLDEYLPLCGFSHYVGYTSQGYYKVSDDSFIWEILSEECGNSEVADIPSLSFSLKNREYLQFTATSEAIGFYKKVFTITRDGYVHTNILDYGYTYKISTESAEKIFEYAHLNKREAPRSQYYYYLIGTVVEVGEGYIIVSDEIRCENPEDALSFKIILNTAKLKREARVVGTTVSIEMIRDITYGDNLTVDFAVSISRCYLDSDGNAWTEE